MATYVPAGVDPRLAQKFVLTDDQGTIVSLAGGVVPVSIGGVLRTILRASINIAASGDTTVIAAPAGAIQTHILKYKVQNTSTSDTTIIYKDNATAINGLGFLLGSRASDDFDAPGGIGEGEILLTAAAPFVINLSAANQLSGYIIYWQG